MGHASCSECFTQLAWQVRLELLVSCIHLDDRGWLGWLGASGDDAATLTSCASTANRHVDLLLRRGVEISRN